MRRYVSQRASRHLWFSLISCCCASRRKRTTEGSSSNNMMPAMSGVDNGAGLLQVTAVSVAEYRHAMYLHRKDQIFVMRDCVVDSTLAVAALSAEYAN